MTTQSLIIDSSALMPSTEALLTAIALVPTVLLSPINLLETSMVLAPHTGDAITWAQLDPLIARSTTQTIPRTPP